MAYLKLSDYSLRISVLHMKEVLAEAVENSGLNDNQVRSNAETWAMETVKSYLVNKYDIATEYALPSTDSPTIRNRQILQVTIDLALYTLHKTINPRDVPDHIEDAFERGIAWLKEARDGLIIVSLSPAPLAVNEQEFPNTFFETQPKFVSRPFQDLKIFDNEA